MKSFRDYSVNKILRPNEEKNDLQNNNVKQEKLIFPSMEGEMHSKQQTKAKILLNTRLLSKSDSYIMDTS